MRLLYKYLGDYKPLLALAMLLAAVNQVFSMLDPFIFGKVIDRFASRAGNFTEAEYVRGVLTLLGAAIGVAMVSRIAKNFQDYCISIITQRIGARLYTDGLRHSLDLPYEVFEDQSSGKTLSILQKARTDSERLISTVINVVFPSIVGIVFVCVYAFSIHWSIAPVYFAAVPIIGFISSALSKRIKKVQTRIVGETTALAGSTTESLRNIELVKSLGLAHQEEERLHQTTNKILGLELQKVRFIRSLSFVQGTFINLLRTSILFLMLFLVFRNELTVGQLYSLLIYSFFIFGPLQELGTIIALQRETQVSLQNLENILAMEPEETPANPTPLGVLKELRFDKVSFSHRSGNRKAVNNINFTIKEGETAAFVGPSGSGKTTLVKLLVGLYRPQEGSITYNGIPYQDLELEALRERIGLVSQEAQLFSGTLAENLKFVRPGATDEEMMNVLTQAAAGNLLQRATKGLDTVIGEGGVKLSGGERQRLSIARALLRKPQLLVFDEATSALDSITEEEISRTIREVSTQEARITILIAHRLSTVRHANRIYVLEGGDITESGTHDDLLELKGLYYAMWRQQVGERKAHAPAGLATAGAGRVN